MHTAAVLEHFFTDAQYCFNHDSHNDRLDTVKGSRYSRNIDMGHGQVAEQ